MVLADGYVGVQVYLHDSTTSASKDADKGWEDTEGQWNTY